MVDNDGKNNYPRDEVWFTDGYGDYVRHYLRAMAAKPELAPADENHILHTTAILNLVNYAGNLNKTLGNDVPPTDLDKVALYYVSTEKMGTETIRLTAKPSKILVEKKEIKEVQSLDKEGFTWTTMTKGGLLKVRHEAGTEIVIYK